jgi:opacity protein-like surface antigen
MVYRRIFLLASLLALPYAMHGQALPAGSRGFSYQVGGAVSLSDTDEVTQHIKGFTFFADADFSKHFGAEIEYHDLNIITPQDFGESSFLLNVRYRHEFGRFHPYGKVGAGIGSAIQNEGFYKSTSSSSHGMYAFGAGLDIALSHKINIRLIDYEYQHWSYPPNGLTPWVASIGAAYHF